MKPNLNDRDIDTLNELRAATDNHLEVGYREGWCKPMDCGGSNGSHHSATLTKLVRHGLAESKGSGKHMTRGSKWYRITSAGRSYLIEHSPKIDEPQFYTGTMNRIR